MSCKALRLAVVLPAAEYERLKRARLAQLQAVRKGPAQLAANAVARRFENYPALHPYPSRLLAQAVDAVQKLELDDMRPGRPSSIGASPFSRRLK